MSPETKTRTGFRTANPHLLALLIYLAALYVLSYPALADPTTMLAANPSGDAVQNFWNNWWIRRAVAAGQNPWFTDMLYSPMGISLVGATLNPFNGFMTVALCTVVGPITAYNLMVVFAFVFGGYTTFLLVRELTGSYWPSVFAGAAFTFSPYHFAHAAGHMQLVSLEWLPFFFYAWIRLLRRPGYGIACLAALAMFLNLLCDYYYTLYAVLGGFGLLVLHGITTRRPLFFVEKRTLLTLACFTAVCSLLCMPLLWQVIRLNAAEEVIGVHEKDLFRNDLLALIIPGQHWRFSALTEWYWSHHPAKNDTENCSYLGWTVIAAGIVGLCTGRRSGHAGDAWSWFAIGAGFFALSLGPTLMVLHESYPAVPMPYELLEFLVPAVALGGVPMRFALMTNLAAAVLAGFGLRYLATRVRHRWLFVLFATVFALEVLPTPEPHEPFRYPAYVEALRPLPPGPVVGTAVHISEELLFQTRFEKPITDGYVARIPLSRFRYREMQRDLLSRGRYRLLLEETRATYLVEHVHDYGEAVDPELKCVYEDETHRIFTRPDHPAPAVSVPSLEVRVDRAPGSTTLHLRWPLCAGRRYLCAFSSLRGPPDYKDGQRFGLVPDALLALSHGQSKYLDNRGVFDAEGRGTVTLHTGFIPDPVPKEIEVWFSVIAFEASPPEAYHRVSRPRRLVITP